MENKESQRAGMIDYYMENGKPVLVIGDGFNYFSVTRVLTDDETTLDKFDEVCGLTDKSLYYSWAKVLGTPASMFKLNSEKIDNTNLNRIMAAWMAKEHGFDDIYYEIMNTNFLDDHPDKKKCDELYERFVSKLEDKEKALAGHALVSYLKTGQFTRDDLWISKTDSRVTPLCVHRSAPGELWLLGDLHFDLLADQVNPLVSGNAKCISVNLRYSRDFDIDEQEALDGGEDLWFQFSSRINGKYKWDSRTDGFDYIPDEAKADVDEIFKKLPWEITYINGNDQWHNQIKITYR